MKETILILDFGSQYTQLIARRLRELNVYCEIHPWNKAPNLNDSIKGVIFSGSPFSVRDNNSPVPPVEKYKGKIPLLGVCFGAQFLAQHFGGEVLPSEIREYGRANLGFVDQSCRLMQNVHGGSQVWMSHGDTIKKIPDNFEKICSTNDVEFAGFRVKDEMTYGIQFHPEVYHSTDGKQLLKNFIVDICKCSQNWTPDAFVESTVSALKEKLGNDKVIMGLSGGVDSSVAAYLLNKAIGSNLHCIFVDNGLLRKDEFNSVLESYKGLGLNVKGVNAADRFYKALAGESDPEGKRKIIGGMFIEVFDEESHKVDGAKWLGQGTIYPDVIESVSATGGPSATIKSHHNVGGLPDFMKLEVVEPLRLLFKDEVRRVGKSLGIPEAIIGRHPFPGPGLGIRILGDITKEKVRILQEVDHIFISGLKRWNLYDSVWQAGAILLPVQSVGVMGD
ncbi:MAG: glutamine-hydrolyzing GMP synthase, partial [Putridiphycobacter sp.]|nr:glutamine-hydrolyzing GMP synthase [Putridiphycobacter sp.]